MTLDDLLQDAIRTLDELTCELVHRADDAMRNDSESQLTACLQLGLRSVSGADAAAPGLMAVLPGCARSLAGIALERVSGVSDLLPSYFFLRTALAASS